VLESKRDHQFPDWQSLGMRSGAALFSPCRMRRYYTLIPALQELRGQFQAVCYRPSNRTGHRPDPLGPFR